MQPDEVPVTVVEDTTMETEEDDSSDDDDDSWNCADAEIKAELDSAITAIFEENRDRVTRQRFHFILQTLLTKSEFLSEDYLLMS